ncbi:MAG TPA: hypothetical protein VIG34_03930 [Xanthobacteraceae bacterium]|jgi:hypothetical protein
MAKFGAGGPPAEDAFTPYLLWGTLALCAVVLAAASIAIAFGGRGDARSAAAKRIAIQAPAPLLAPSLAELELARLSDAVRLLSADRERLAGRLEQIERSIGDITASVTRERPAALAIPTVAAAPPAQALAAPRAAADSIATRTEFAVDLGGDTSVEALRALWATMRGNHPALANLKPLVSIRDGGKPGVVELRLVAGPLANAAAAARICALLAVNQVACQTAVFDGQRLALR